MADMWWTEIAAGPGRCLLLILGLVLSWAAVIAAVPALIRPNRPSVGTATDPGRTTADPGCRPLDQGIALEPARPDPGRQPS